MLTAAPLCFHTNGVTKVYHTGEIEVHALRGVDLDIPEGELVVLLGPSGSGKSTLLNILGGIDRPTAGKVMFRDKNLTECDDSELTWYRRLHVGFVLSILQSRSEFDCSGKRSADHRDCRASHEAG